MERAESLPLPEYSFILILPLLPVVSETLFPLNLVVAKSTTKKYCCSNYLLTASSANPDQTAVLRAV